MIHLHHGDRRELLEKCPRLRERELWIDRFDAQEKLVSRRTVSKVRRVSKGQLKDRYPQLGKLTFWPLIFIIWPREPLDAYAFRKFDAFLRRQLNGR